MIVSTHQPYFCPYPGFFSRPWCPMSSSCWIPFNSRGTTLDLPKPLQNDQGTLWTTIPVYKKGLGLQRIDEVRICYDGKWPEKHLESLQVAYARSPYLEDHRAF